MASQQVIDKVSNDDDVWAPRSLGHYPAYQHFSGLMPFNVDSPVSLLVNGIGVPPENWTIEYVRFSST